MADTLTTTPAPYCDDAKSARSVHHEETGQHYPSQLYGADDTIFKGQTLGDGGSIKEGCTDIERQKTAEGNAHFHRLGWKRLTIVLIVEAIALGSLSLPHAFATLGMVAGVFFSIGLGLLAIYTGNIIGQVKIKYPHVAHYADAGKLLLGRAGYEIIGAMFAFQLTLLVGSHCLTGTIAFLNITDYGTCSIVFGITSAIILLLIAIPPSFTEVAFLGYIDFASILVAILITIVATGVSAAKADGGLSSVNWSAWPKSDISFADGFIATTNIMFAYSFSIGQFSFMDEMHSPEDFPKSIWTLGVAEICIYTTTGALIYAFVGQDVQSPALLSAGETVSRIAFGVALPVIFISGSINVTVVSRYIHGRMFRNSITRFINTRNGWLTWLAVITTVTTMAWVIAEAIPIFSDLLSISSALFTSGFTYYLPALMWFSLIKEGKWYARKNICKSLLNCVVFLIGMVVLGGGLYASTSDLVSTSSSPGVFPRSRPNTYSYCVVEASIRHSYCQWCLQMRIAKIMQLVEYGLG